ncbi:PREDICTED: uncharacterized protein LOC104810616 [Tarenaya hassleriana]|uniref:uncharacterized protein LOC104810616 n=1 Tax=Tarenaya hassleriana TaxID=28532 RepID=UPI00053C5964|nr:PREDICTED: uncharacterized protein LOC104810616 [Tarenaya hassleriana]
MEGFNKILKTLALCFVLQVTTFSLTVFSQQQQKSENATVKIMVQNGLKNPTPNRVLYRCWSRNKDFGWRRSVITGSRYTFEVPVVSVGEDDKVNHVCHFRSELGFVNILISQSNARKCRNSICVHLVTANGIVFRGIDFSKGKFSNPRAVTYQQLPWRKFPGLVPRIPVVGMSVGSKA